MKLKLITVLFLTTLYTIIRYIIFGNVDPINFPSYLLNKSVSMASAIYILFASISYAKGQIDEMKFWGSISWYTAILHVLFSLSLLSRSYYSKFFGLEKMNLIGELTILFGVVAIFTFWFIRAGKKIFKNIYLLQILARLFVAAHLIVMGFAGWMNISKWHGGLPPISLLSFISLLLSIILFMWTKRFIQK